MLLDRPSRIVLIVVLAVKVIIPVWTNQDSLGFLNRILRQNETTLVNSEKRLSEGTWLLPDDPANHSIYEILESHIRELDALIFQHRDMISLYSVTEGYLGQITEVLQRIRELCVARSSVLYAGDAREFIDSEIGGLYDDILSVLRRAEFNKKNLFAALAEDREFAERFRDERRYLLDTVDSWLQFVLRQRALHGARARSLEARLRSRSVGRENLADFQSSIWDVDFAEESAFWRRQHLLFLVDLLFLAEIQK